MSCPGFYASTVSEYAGAFKKALLLPEEESGAMRQRARISAKRFSEGQFAIGWNAKLIELVELSSNPLTYPRWPSMITLFVVGISLALFYSDFTRTISVKDATGCMG